MIIKDGIELDISLSFYGSQKHICNVKEAENWGYNVAIKNNRKYVRVRYINGYLEVIGRRKAILARKIIH